MLDYGRRLLVVAVLALFISLLFIGAATSRADSLNEQEWIWPTTGEISDYFGTRAGKHKGIDIAGSEDADVHAVSDGVVSKSYYSDSYGNVVFVEHPLEGYETVYAHLNERTVREGEYVEKGQIIGKMGNTGRSSGVHLHFEVHQSEWTAEKENALDPLIVFADMKKETIEVSAHEQNHIAAEQQKHIVKKGETLWSISDHYGVPVKTLLVLNNISDPSRIFEGQVIQIKTNG
ncbi:peptidoglycan DD-metalloendopeptidase family protein [Bacillus sp. AGMB 02131]|uniref:Peptidoglycan DD-metalloendopeptidase family protein n=1 Tax=Peribacillus faecalis TaxID=2772559 RepID=A0A927D3D5_9BACI|nr:peptidoglycan DD-metalloendopeptidase family protein [Peribacillus faecalis]MBD3110354.1 peptidoglycan DD-metalloendopeptidase family protein [Peribacillus faecalis]